DAAWADRTDAVVDDLQVQALEIREVARQVERDDLALALDCDLVGAGKAAQDQARPGGSVALTNDVLVGLDGHNLHRQLLEGMSLVIREREDALDLADHRIVFGVE